MSLESATNISQLNPSNPAGTDKLATGDDHIRLIKATLKATFPNITGPVLLSQDQLASILPSLVPFGIITDWYGSAVTVPGGWAICNGQTVNKSDGTGTVTTPDLQDRVTAGASATNVLGSARGQTLRSVTSEAGGSHSHVGTIDPGGAHAHVITGTASSSPAGVTVNKTSQTSLAGGGSQTAVSTVTLTDPGHTHGITGTTDSAGSHTHTATIDTVPPHAHSILDIDVTQPTYALHKIMKI